MDVTDSSTTAEHDQKSVKPVKKISDWRTKGPNTKPQPEVLSAKPGDLPDHCWRKYHARRSRLVSKPLLVSRSGSGLVSPGGSGYDLQSPGQDLQSPVTPTITSPGVRGPPPGFQSHSPRVPPGFTSHSPRVRHRLFHNRSSSAGTPTGGPDWKKAMLQALTDEGQPRNTPLRSSTTYGQIQILESLSEDLTPQVRNTPSRTHSAVG